jgi:hypothetical protein
MQREIDRQRDAVLLAHCFRTRRNEAACAALARCELALLPSFTCQRLMRRADRIGAHPPAQGMKECRDR